VIISVVPPEYLNVEWEKASAFIQMALDAMPNRWRIQDVLDNILQGRETLWGVFDEDSKEMVAAITTVIQQYPLCRRLVIQHVGGEFWQMKEWTGSLMGTLECYAIDAGCTGIDGWGRDGWVREVVAQGGKKVASMYSLELQEN